MGVLQALQKAKDDKRVKALYIRGGFYAFRLRLWLCFDSGVAFWESRFQKSKSLSSASCIVLRNLIIWFFLFATSWSWILAELFC